MNRPLPLSAALLVALSVSFGSSAQTRPPAQQRPTVQYNKPEQTWRRNYGNKNPAVAQVPDVVGLGAGGRGNFGGCDAHDVTVGASGCGGPLPAPSGSGSGGGAVCTDTNASNYGKSGDCGPCDTGYVKGNTGLCEVNPGGGGSGNGGGNNEGGADESGNPSGGGSNPPTLPPPPECIENCGKDPKDPKDPDSTPPSNNIPKEFRAGVSVGEYWKTSGSLDGKWKWQGNVDSESAGGEFNFPPELKNKHRRFKVMWSAGTEWYTQKGQYKYHVEGKDYSIADDLNMLAFPWWKTPKHPCDGYDQHSYEYSMCAYQNKDWNQMDHMPPGLLESLMFRNSHSFVWAGDCVSTKPTCLMVVGEGEATRTYTSVLTVINKATGEVVYTTTLTVHPLK